MYEYLRAIDRLAETMIEHGYIALGQEIQSHVGALNEMVDEIEEDD